MSEHHDLPKRAAWLVLNHAGWVKRRVESIQFEPSGSTRRLISFDLTIPDAFVIPGMELRASTGDPHDDLVVVPLTFMRKGTLTRLDVRDATGGALASAGFGENGRLTQAAFDYLLDDAHPGDPALKQPAPAGLETGQYRWWRTGVANVIYSSGQPAPAPDASNTHAGDLLLEMTRTTKELDLQRKSYFDALLAVLVDGRDVATVPAPPAGVEELGDGLTKRVNAAASTKNIDRDRLGAALMLLSTLCESYAFTVLAPRDQVTSRTIIKVAFDSDVPDQARPTAPRFAAYPVSIGARSAASVHVDLSPADGTKILNVTASDTIPATGTDSIENSCDVTVLGDRVHLVMPRKSAQLVTVNLAIWCLKRPLDQARGGALAALLTSIGAMIMTLLQYQGQHKFLTADNVLSIIALVLALWLATIFEGGHHRLTQAIAQPLTRSITWIVIITCAALLSLALATDPDGIFHTGHIPWFALTIQTMCIVTAATFCWRTHRWAKLRSDDATAFARLGRSPARTISATTPARGGRLPVHHAPNAATSLPVENDAAEVAAFTVMGTLAQPDAARQHLARTITALTTELRP